MSSGLLNKATTNFMSLRWYTAAAAPESYSDREDPMARPRFNPTPEQRKVVEAMAGFGIPEEHIARIVGEHGIDPKTLRKHFRTELDTGATRANAAVAQALF
jgi:hypothetical protein